MAKKYPISSVEVEIFPNTVIFNWQVDSVGEFGMVTFKIVKDSDGNQKVEFDTEYMSKEFVKAVFDFVVDQNLDE